MPVPADTLLVQAARGLPEEGDDMSHVELARALDELVHAAAHPQDPGRTATVLSAVVLDLERATGSGLGPAAGEPLVVLQRRLGRLHRLLLRAPAQVDAARVRSHLDALVRGTATDPGCGCPQAPRSRAVQVAPATV